MWTNLLNERSKNIHSRLQNLEDRVKQLEKSFEEARVAIPKDIEERAEKLTIQLNEFQDSFDEEQKRRIERENAIAADLTQFTAKTKSDFEEEKVYFSGGMSSSHFSHYSTPCFVNLYFLYLHHHHHHPSFDATLSGFHAPQKDREDKFSTLHSQLTETTEDRTRREEKFQSFVKEEVTRLSKEIKGESTIREKEDDEIIAALRGFSKKLQESLKVINSIDKD